MKRRGLNRLITRRGTREQGPGPGVRCDTLPTWSLSCWRSCLQTASAGGLGRKGLHSRVTSLKVTPLFLGEPACSDWSGSQGCLMKGWPELRTTGKQHPLPQSPLGGGRGVGRRFVRPSVKTASCMASASGTGAGLKSASQNAPACNLGLRVCSPESPTCLRQGPENLVTFLTLCDIPRSAFLLPVPAAGKLFGCTRQMLLGRPSK